MKINPRTAAGLCCFIILGFSLFLHKITDIDLIHKKWFIPVSCLICLIVFVFFYRKNKE